MSSNKYLSYDGLNLYNDLITSYVNTAIENQKPITKTTDEWYEISDFIPEKNQIIVFSDYSSTTIDGVQTYIPSIKIGNGIDTVISLQFITVNTANIAKKVEHALHIGTYTYDGSEEVNIPVYNGENV